ncbi:hypothetical protein C0214_11015 [Methylobacterium sp. DM1]|nr:hypothetical protein C0214_11015 [Methylobacterium sp. DM1]MBI1691965.1 hypothetical protein [Methylorubrum sp. DB1722]
MAPLRANASPHATGGLWGPHRPRPGGPGAWPAPRGAWRVGGGRPAWPSALARAAPPPTCPAPAPWTGPVAPGRGWHGEPERLFIFAVAQGTHVRPPSVPGMSRMVDRAHRPRAIGVEDRCHPGPSSPMGCHGAAMASARRTDDGHGMG